MWYLFEKCQIIILMLTESEKKFISYWESIREKEAAPLRQFVLGLPYGLLFALPIAFITWTAKYWYVRADWEANAKMNPVLLTIIILIITLFVAFFYKKHQFELRDQEYMRLKNKQRLEEEKNSPNH